MNATQRAQKELLAALNSCSTVTDVENIVKQILNIDESNVYFDSIVDKLCIRGDIATGSLADTAEIVVEYLESLESKLQIKAYRDTADLETAAEMIIGYYDKMGKLSMERFKRIMMTNGYVVGIAFKSTRVLTNKISNKISEFAY